MVMHARKLPRIDDGYADKRDAQSYQSSQYPSKATYGNHSDRYDRSPSRNSPASRNSPRYSNKSSYIERTKEKYDRGTDGSPSRRTNHTGNGSGSNHSSSTHHGNQDKNRGSSNVKDNKNEAQKSAIRVCGDWSEHLSSSGKKYYYNLKTEVSQWEKPRDWSDTAATRPDRHSIDSRSSNDKHNKEDKRRHSSGGLEKREKHLGDLKHLVVDGNPKPDKMYLFEKLQQSQSKLQAENRANKQFEHKDLQRRTDEGIVCDYSNSKSSSRPRRDSEGARTGGSRQTSKNDCDEMDSPGSTPTSHMSASTPHPHLTPNNINLLGINILSELNSQEPINQALQTLQKLQQALSRQIAAAQTSVSNQSNSQGMPIQALTHSLTVGTTSGLPQPDEALLHCQNSQGASIHPTYLASSPQIVPLHNHATISTPSISHLANSRSLYVNSQNNLTSLGSSPQPIVTVAVSQMAASPMTTGTTTIPITQSGNQVHRGNTVYGKFLGSSQQSGLVTGYMSQVGDDRSGGENRGVEGGGTNDRSPCASPTPSDTSSQGAPVDPDMFTGQSLGQREHNLMASLGQYYKNESVAHVTGWQGELVERQARLYHDESLRIGSLISSQVSVELKRARSLVRVEEIQSTLHEQRNLFLAQQIAELENMKPVSSVSSFLPVSSVSPATNNT
ncbi:WW domain-containing adapter protein with coiled-coil-like [Mya arenaria]|uniref:WW domain-containing adapter protein with coiled-coil-like n=1 Tax=Mya arenaria TaxID=6604 RepID=UPI0022E329FA|nr:WW domain-containing adapter protein with coiled-coil-like [Mya arenaria]